MSERNKIVLNRAVCNNCGAELISRNRHDFVTCDCGRVSVDGGRDYLKRVAPDWDAFRDTSIVTSTYSRRGLLVEAYMAGIEIYCVGPDGVQTTAEVGDYVVYEAEGGATAWDAVSFHQHHELVDEES